MTLRSMSRTSAAVLAVVGLFWSSPRAWAETPPNYRVNDILGPDELLGTVDDDDPNYDPNDRGVVANINSLEFGVTPPELITFRVVDQPSIAVDHTCVRKGWVYVCYASEVNRWSNDPNNPIEPNNPAGPCDPGNCQPDIFVSRYRYDPNDADVNDFLWETVRVNDDDVWIGDPPNQNAHRSGHALGGGQRPGARRRGVL